MLDAMPAVPPRQGPGSPHRERIGFPLRPATFHPLACAGTKAHSDLHHVGTMNSTAMGHLEPRLKSSIRGEALFDAYTRGRYATDASHYQIMPLGVVIPRDENDLAATLAMARDEGVSVVARGGGTSQCGQTVNDGLVVDMSKYMNRIIGIDASNRRCTVQPGIVLDELNRILKPHGLWFPVDVSTASRATIGGMTGNNSCGTRSIRYGTMR